VATAMSMEPNYLLGVFTSSDVRDAHEAAAAWSRLSGPGSAWCERPSAETRLWGRLDVFSQPSASRASVEAVSQPPAPRAKLLGSLDSALRLTSGGSDVLPSMGLSRQSVGMKNNDKRHPQECTPRLLVGGRPSPSLPPTAAHPPRLCIALLICSRSHASGEWCAPTFPPPLWSWLSPVPLPLLSTRRRL